jgi:hypothetical protein
MLTRILEDLRLAPRAFRPVIVDRSGKVIGCVTMFAFAQVLLIALASDGDLKKS